MDCSAVSLAHRPFVWSRWAAVLVAVPLGVGVATAQSESPQPAPSASEPNQTQARYVLDPELPAGVLQGINGLPNTSLWGEVETLAETIPAFVERAATSDNLAAAANLGQLPAQELEMTFPNFVSVVGDLTVVMPGWVWNSPLASDAKVGEIIVPGLPNAGLLDEQVFQISQAILEVEETVLEENLAAMENRDQTVPRSQDLQEQVGRGANRYPSTEMDRGNQSPELLARPEYEEGDQPKRWLDPRDPRRAPLDALYDSLVVLGGPVVVMELHLPNLPAGETIRFHCRDGGSFWPIENQEVRDQFWQQVLQARAASVPPETVIATSVDLDQDHRARIGFLFNRSSGLSRIYATTSGGMMFEVPLYQGLPSRLISVSPTTATLPETAAELEQRLLDRLPVEVQTSAMPRIPSTEQSATR